MDERLINTNIEEENEGASVEETGAIEVEISEGFGYVAGATGLHSTLPDRNYSNQHEIDSITGLRDELNFIKSPRTIYSNGNNVATYYEWESSTDDPYGRFVSVVDGYKIKICNGTDIVGVTVEDAGFIGNQSGIPRDGAYGLVVTSGVVSVHCDPSVKTGDYVVSSSSGHAEKSTGNYGYKVLGTANKNNMPHAIIALGVQADVTGVICDDLNATKEQVKANYNNIVAAMNLANDAYNKASDTEATAGSANKDAGDAKDAADNANKNASDALDTANKAKEIAESAKTFAMAECANAFNRANDAWAKADNVATETYSLCAKIDQYSIGEYSQARGLTLEQAQEILVPGMIYVPTKHGEVEYHTEVYEYTNAPEKVESFDKIEYRDPKVVYYDGKEYLYRVNYDWIESQEMPKYERIFTPGYLYRWESIQALGRNGWVTIDKYHNAVNYNSEIETNDASKSVYFFPTEPDIAEGDDFGYWYTDAEEIKDKDGNTGAYNPYTLYKWEGNHWTAVARLAGNCNNRVASLVTQTANSLSAEITNARGSTASIGERITNTESEVYSIAQWTINPDTGEQYSLATIKQTADAAGASISQIVEWAGPDGVVSTSSIVQSINDSGSEVYIDADHIRLEGIVTMDSNITITEDGKIIAKSANIVSGYIGNNISGFEINSNNIRNVYKYSSGVQSGKEVSAYMTSYNTLETGTYIDYECNNQSFVYVGTDGVGVMRTGSYDSSTSGRKGDKQTWMADGKLFSNSAEITGKIIATDGEFTGKVTATSGYIGYSSSGFEIGANSIYNVLTSSYNKKTYYMTSPRVFKTYDSDTIDAQAGGIDAGNSRGYVYVGTDGIGAMSIEYKRDTSGSDAVTYGEIVAHTYIADGHLYSDSATILTSVVENSSIIKGTIGEGTYKWNVGSNAESNSAYLYCGSENIASSGGIIMPDTNHVYLGTDGMSYTLGAHADNLDYTTLIRSGNILVYGDGQPGHSRAVHLHYNGIDFFHAGANVISKMDNLAGHKRGGIGINANGSLYMRSNGTMYFQSGDTVCASIDSSCMRFDEPFEVAKKYINEDGSSSSTYSSGLTGFVKVVVEHVGQTNTYNYLYFVQGVLVGVYWDQPYSDDENLTRYS